MAGRFRVQHVAATPRGWKVRTVTRGAHRIRIAFPPGQRKKGAGQVVEILHPGSERNPCRVNPAELVLMGANPSASELFEKFHGRPATGETQYDEPHIPAQKLTELGDLTELTLLRPAGWKHALLNWTGRGVKLASNAQGTQLYAVSGDQKISRGEITRIGGDNSKDLVDLGEALSVVYRAKKSQTDFKATNWEHKFGEEGGRRPQVMYDRRIKRVQFVGGDYRVEAPGIIN